METISLSKEQIADKLSEVDFNKFDSILTGIAKKTKKKKLNAGTMFFAEFRAKIAHELSKPVCKEILEIVLSSLKGV